MLSTSWTRRSHSSVWDRHMYLRIHECISTYPSCDCWLCGHSTHAVLRNQSPSCHALAARRSIPAHQRQRHRRKSHRDMQRLISMLFVPRDSSDCHAYAVHRLVQVTGSDAHHAVTRGWKMWKSQPSAIVKPCQNSMVLCIHHRDVHRSSANEHSSWAPEVVDRRI